MGYTFYRFLVFSHLQLSLNLRVCSVKPERYEFTKHCFQFVIVLKLRVVGLLGQQPEPRLQEASIVQYFYFRNTLLKSKGLSQI